MKLKKLIGGFSALLGLLSLSSCSFVDNLFPTKVEPTATAPKTETQTGQGTIQTPTGTVDVTQTQTNQGTVTTTIVKTDTGTATITQTQTATGSITQTGTGSHTSTSTHSHTESTGQETSTGTGAATNTGTNTQTGTGTEVFEEKIIDNVVYDDFQIYFLELGNEYAGDCTYIKAGENDILIDAGSRAASASTIETFVDQYCTDKKLEYVIATHAHQDHIEGFTGANGIFSYYDVETIVDFTRKNTTSKCSTNYLSLRDQLVSTGTKHFTSYECFNETNGAQSTYDLGTDMSFTVLYNYYDSHSSSDENNYSVCTLFTYGEHNFMFTGDLEQEGEEKLAAYYDGSTPKKTLPQCELFKGGHHGSATSSNDCLLSLIKPEICCVCCCAGSTEYTNNYQTIFPTQAFIDRIAKYTDRVYITSMYDEKALRFKSLNGNICISSNKEHIGVSATNNTIKLKDTTWFNEKIYVIASGTNYIICSGKGKKDFYTVSTPGAVQVTRRIWPS